MIVGEFDTCLLLLPLGFMDTLTGVPSSCFVLGMFEIHDSVYLRLSS